MGARDSERHFCKARIPDSPMPSGPALLKLNLGTCTLETGSRRLGIPPFWILFSLPPYQTLFPTLPQQHLQLLRCPLRGHSRPTRPALPWSFYPTLIHFLCSFWLFRTGLSDFEGSPGGQSPAASRQHSPAPPRYCHPQEGHIERG